MTLGSILAAASRARTLATDLERSNRPEDRHQVAAGVRHELDAILRLVRGELERLAELAAGDAPGKVRNDAPETSRAAAEAITVKTGTTRWRIMELLWEAGEPDTYRGRQFKGGCTDYELQQQLKLNPSTERPRRGELVDANLVRAVGTRKHSDGFGGFSEWRIWALTQAGADAYRERIPGPPRVVTPTGEPTLF